MSEPGPVAGADDDTDLLRALNQSLDRLLDLPAAERERELAAIAAAEPERAQRLQRLLAVAMQADRTDAFAAQRGQRLDRVLHRDRSGERLGPWQLDQRIAAGGMGVVYRGHRADGAFERQAAIKCLAPALAGLESWFRREIALLARLEHPAIARVLDGGTDAEGRGYLVMEWIEGRDLDAYAADARVPYVQRLAVFDTMLAGTAHAHQHLVVHRDLKPGNVRVDVVAQPKLLDFGIAVLLGDADTTAAAVPALTPAWAAPEQLRRGEITTRTDVHALGRLLLLLMGADPGDPQALQPQQLRHAPKSARAALAAIAAKACADDPARRYADAGAFREELQRMRGGQPVLALGDGWGYRARCFVSRHALAVTLVAAVGVALLGATVFSLRQAAAAEAARDAAVLETRRADSVREFLQLSLRDAADLSGEDVSLREALRLASQRVGREYRDDRERAVDVLISLAELHNQLGDYKTALPLIEQGLERVDARAHPQQHAALAYEFGLAAPRLGRAEEALPLLDAAAAYWATQARFRQRHGQLLQMRGRVERSLGRIAEGLASTAAGHRLLAADALTSPRDLAIGDVNLGAALLQSGEIAPARAAFERGLQRFDAAGLGATPMALDARNNLAATLAFEGRYRDAMAQFEETVRVREARFGASAALGSALSNLAKMALAAAAPDAARAHFDRALPMLAQFVGADSPDYAAALAGSAECALVAGDVAGAARDAARAQAIVHAALGEAHPMHAVFALIAARAAIASGQRDHGLVLLRDAVARLTAAGRGLTQQQAQARIALAEAVLDAAPAEADRNAAAVSALPTTALPESHPLRIEAGVIAALVARDAPAAATAVSALAAVLGATHPRVVDWSRRQARSGAVAD